MDDSKIRSREEIGNDIRNWCADKAHRTSHEKLAEILNVKPKTMQRILDGKRELHSGEIARLSAYMGKDVDYFIERAESQSIHSESTVKDSGISREEREVNTQLDDIFKDILRYGDLRLKEIVFQELRGLELNKIKLKVKKMTPSIVSVKETS